MNNDWLEEAMVAWGSWRGTVGLAEGWGGAGNAMDRSGWAKPSAGVHSDPVLAEYIRSIKLHHGDSALINRLLTDFDQKDREIVFLRYVGEKVAKTTKTIISVGTVEVSEYTGHAGKMMHRPRMKLSIEVPLHVDYSGKLTYTRIADLSGISEDAAARVVNRVKKQLRFVIVMMAKVRKGMAGESLRAA